MPMKTIEGYSKEKYTNTSVLLAGGGAKALSDFIGSLSWDSTNKKIKYTPVEGSTTDLVTLSWDNIANKPTSLPANGGNADTVDGYHIEDLDFRYVRTGYSFISPSDDSMTGSTDLQDWVTNMYNQGGYKGYSSITVGSWWWVRSLDFSSPAGTIRTSGAMIVYSGDGSNNKNYKHFLVLDAYAELYGITSNEESWKYYSRFLNNRNYTDFVYSKSTSDNRYLRKDTNDSTSYQYSFTKTDDHAIQVGTIRGTAVGSQTGDFIHLYERVAIGSPSGWGSRNAPSYGLSTYGGAWLATDTGNVGIGTDSPEAKLEVTGNGKFTNSLSVNTGNNFNFYTDTNLFFVNKSLENWRALSYEYWVYLLIPVITTTNTSAMNFIEGTFNFWKTGSNIYDNVHVNLNCVYNVLEYSLMSYGQGTDWKLVRCTYNGVDYYALQGYYHANPYTHTNFCGHVNSTYRGGNNTTDKPLNLPYGVCYCYAPGGNNQILNSEVYNSISTTLTTSVITKVNRRGLSNPGGFIGPLTGNATTATYASSAGSVAWSNVTGKPTNHVTTDTTQTITGEKTFATNILTISNPNGGDATLKLYRGGNTAWSIVDTVGNLKFNDLNSNTTRLTLFESSQGGYAKFADNVYSTGFNKEDSSNDYVLLGGGGHKALSDFSMAHSHPYLSFSSIYPTNTINLNDYFSSSTMYKVYYDYSGSPKIQNGPYESDAGAVINFPTYSGTQIYFNYYNNDVKIRTHYNGHITNWDTFITSSNWSSYISIPSVGNGTVTVTQAGSTIGSFTMNQSGNTLIALNDTNTNYYPIRSYTTGLQISSYSGSADCALFVPYATNAIAGVVSTATQSFAGQKTFLNGIKVGSISGDQSTDNAKIYFGDGKYVWIGESPQDDALMLNCGTSKNIYFSFAGSTAVTSSNYSTYAKIYMSNSGAVYASSGFYESSDERLKSILNPVKVNLDDLSKLRKVYYLWNNTPEDGRQLGMIAQDVQKLYPELVSTDQNTGYLSLAYDKLSVIALEAIDTLYEEYKQLKERVNELEKLLHSK